MFAVAVAVIVLKGTVTIGPLTPVCRAGTPCDGPASRIVLTFASPSRIVRATTDVSGAYTVKLAAGTYSVKASKGMRITPARILVRVGAVRRNFAIDTGIR